MRKAIIIGASSGIGSALAKALAMEGYEIGLVARREKELLEVQKDLRQASYIKTIDISKPVEAVSSLKELIHEMGFVSLIVVNAGTGYLNPELEIEKELATINVNICGFTAMAAEAFRYFETRNEGHIVGISSISALRGNAAAPAYNASKAYVSNYLEGLRVLAFRKQLNITITDIKPGYVDTQMAQGKGLFWVAPVDKAAAQIVSAIKLKKPHAYITKRWRLIGWLLKVLPFKLYRKIS